MNGGNDETGTGVAQLLNLVQMVVISHFHFRTVAQRIAAVRFSPGIVRVAWGFCGDPVERRSDVIVDIGPVPDAECLPETTLAVNIGERYAAFSR